MTTKEVSSRSAPTAKEPLCSVLIAAHNAVQFVGEAIGSALAQTYPRVQVVVVDDGSSDGSEDVIRKFGDAIRTVRISNSGTAMARNRALALSTGEIVALLDHDDRWHPGRLEACVQMLQSADSLGFVTTDAFLIDAHGDTTGARFYAGPRQFPEHDRLGAILRANFVYASVVMWRSLVQRCGGFDVTAPVGCDDYDLWLKAMLCGAMPGLVPQPLADYRVHDQNLSRDAERMEEGRLLLLERHLPDFWKQGVYGVGHDAWRIGTRLIARGERARAARFFVAAARAPGKSSWQRARTFSAIPVALMAPASR